MKRHNAIYTVALSKAQINEILFVIGERNYPSADLKQAQSALRRMLKETKASNDSSPEGKTA